MNLTTIFGDANRWARAIVLKRVAITTTLAAALGVLVTLRIIPIGLSGQVSGVVAVAFTLLVAVLGAFSAQAATTPADITLQPVSSNGVPLIEVGTVTAGVKQASQILTDPPSHTFNDLVVVDPPPGTTLAP